MYVSLFCIPWHGVSHTSCLQASGQPLGYTPRGAPRPSIENIVKGVTATKLFDLYNATDLREYCKYGTVAYIAHAYKPQGNMVSRLLERRIS